MQRNEQQRRRKRREKKTKKKSIVLIVKNPYSNFSFWKKEITVLSILSLCVRFWGDPHDFAGDEMETREPINSKQKPSEEATGTASIWNSNYHFSHKPTTHTYCCSLRRFCRFFFGVFASVLFGFGLRKKHFNFDENKANIIAQKRNEKMDNRITKMMLCKCLIKRSTNEMLNVRHRFSAQTNNCMLARRQFMMSYALWQWCKLLKWIVGCNSKSFMNLLHSFYSFVFNRHAFTIIIIQ